MAARAAVHGAAPKVLPPSSPFGELLRRSHFASFDPKIRQTYTAPASYISRGNWGLKQPIANRNRYSEIVLKNFEEHEMFTEWDRASVQVRLVKRVEELNLTPTLIAGTWASVLGAGSNAMDSEFAPQELQREARRLKKQRRAMMQKQAKADPLMTWIAESQATKRPTDEKSAHDPDEAKEVPYNTGPDRVSVSQPNPAAMSLKQFTQYLDELRTLRPKFLTYIRHELAKDRQDVQDLSDEELVHKLGTEAMSRSLHRLFLGQHTQYKHQEMMEFARDDSPNTPQPIKSRPHKFAGLMYANPTNVETYYSTDHQPGFILRAPSTSARHYDISEWVAAFAGLTARLNRSDAGPSPTPLIHPSTQEGIARTDEGAFDIESSERPMRLSKLCFEAPPVVVGPDAPMKPFEKYHPDIKLYGDVVVKGGVSQHFRENDHTPGSINYNVHNPKTESTGRRNLGVNIFDVIARRNKQHAVPPREPESTIRESRLQPPLKKPEVQVPLDKSEGALGMLQRMIGRKKPKD